MAKLLHNFMRPQFAAESQKMRVEILRYCGEHNLDSEAVVGALADVLATIAAQLDCATGKRELDDRLDSFLARVHETYDRLRDQREAVK